MFPLPLVAYVDEIQDVLDNTDKFVKSIAAEAEPSPLTVMSAVNQTQTYVQVATPLIDDLEAVVAEVLEAANRLLAALEISEVPVELTSVKEKVAAFERGLKNAATSLPGLLRDLTAKPAAPTNVSATA